MISPIFLDGAPNWVDLGTPDLDGATAFYRELFGWDLIPGGPEVGGYGMLTLDGRYVGGVMTVSEEEAPERLVGVVPVARRRRHRPGGHRGGRQRRVRGDGRPRLRPHGRLHRTRPAPTSGCGSRRSTPASA
ncbi:hypothetical protein SBADM41S_10594 [Streptomyces badius]